MTLTRGQDACVFRQAIAGLLVAAAAVGSVGCQDESEVVPVSTVVAISDVELEFTFACHDQIRLEVDQEPDRVTIRGLGEGRIDGDCGSLVTTTLDEPLGDRTLIDAGSGRVLTVTPTGE